jgi:hypothetical protein
VISYDRYLAILAQSDASMQESARLAFVKLLEKIRAGAKPRAALDAVLKEFNANAIIGFREALNAVLESSLGLAAVKAYKVGRLKLSTALYANAMAVAATSRTIIEKHMQGLHDARELRKALYEGYNFQDDPLKIVKPLPKYLQEEFNRFKAAALKTPALRAAYLDAIKRAEAGAGMAELEKALRVAFYERNRYLANRIARTELHRNYTDQVAREVMDDDAIEYVQIRLSSKHPKTDICDLHAKLDKYGLGPGTYPKAVSPKPPFHPHCYCLTAPKIDLDRQRQPKERPGAERAFLAKLPPKEARDIAGSWEKRRRVLEDKEALETIYNEGKDPLYHWKRFGQFGTPIPKLPPKPQPKSTTDLFHLDDFEQIGPQAGSNPGGLYQNKFTGEKVYVKFPKSEAHAQNEVLAGKLYELAGVDAAEVIKLVDSNGKIGVASKIIENLKHLNPAELKKAKGVREGFAVDAWLANWDVVGLGYDNLLIDATGKALRVDAGGALLFRAQGGKKGMAFGDKVNELLTLRDKAMNPQAAAVFGDISDAALKKSLKKVTELKDADIDRLVDAYGPADERAFLKATLKARRDDLKGVLAELSKPKPKAGDRLPVDVEALKRKLGFEWDQALNNKKRKAFAKKYKLTDDEVAAVFAYSRNWYTEMNGVLRKQIPEMPEIRNLINACINGVVRADPFAGKALRGVSSSSLSRHGILDLFMEAHGTKGNYVRWNGFTSTSDAALGGNFSGEFQLTILDARGGRIQKLSHYDTSENEILLPPGSIMVVEDVSQSGSTWRITVKMVDAAPDDVHLYEL